MNAMLIRQVPGTLFPGNTSLVSKRYRPNDQPTAIFMKKMMVKAPAPVLFNIHD